MQASIGVIAKEAATRNLAAGALRSRAAAFEPAAKNAADVQFIAHSPNMTVALAADGIRFAVKPRGHAAAGDMLGINVRGSQDLEWQGKDKLPGETNYFIGNNPNQWRTHTSRYERVETNAAQPVSLSIYNVPSTGQRQGTQPFEYDIRTAPGVDASKLRLDLHGAKDLRIDHEGNLVMRVGGRELQMNRPAIYEQVSATATTTTVTRKKSTSSTRKRSTTTTHRSPAARDARRCPEKRKAARRTRNAAG